MFSGNIPESITVIAKEPQEIRWRFDDLEPEEGEVNAAVVVTPAFATDSSNEKTIETGRQWAKGRGKQQEVRETTSPNEPFADLQIVNLEHRAQGGRAWKVITKDGYYFDLREDILLEALYACGIDKGGVLKGQYIWGKVGSQMKIVRVGSQLHERLLEATRRGKIKKVGIKNFEIGGVYETKAGIKFIFLGWVHTVEFDCKSKYGYGGLRTVEDWTKKEISKTGLFFEVNSYEKRHGDDDFGLAYHLENGCYGFKLKKSPSFVISGERIIVPPNIIQRVKEYHWNVKHTPYYYSDLINMQPLDQPIVIHPNFVGKVP